MFNKITSGDVREVIFVPTISKKKTLLSYDTLKWWFQIDKGGAFLFNIIDYWEDS